MNTSSKGGKKIESILMMHDVLFTSAERFEMIRFFSNLLQQVDPKRHTKLQNQGIL